VWEQGRVRGEKEGRLMEREVGDGRQVRGEERIGG